MGGSNKGHIMKAGKKIIYILDGVTYHGTIAAVLEPNQIPLGYSKDHRYSIHWDLNEPGWLPQYVTFADIVEVKGE